MPSRDETISRCRVDNEKRIVIMYGSKGQIVSAMSFETLSMFCSYKFQREIEAYRKRLGA